MSGYIEIFLRSVITFVGLLILALLMGRKQLSQITFFDYIVGITIGSIAAFIAVDRSIGIIDGAIATVVWCAMPIIIGYIAVKNIAFRRLIDGEPKVVIQNGNIIKYSPTTPKDMNIPTAYKGIMTELIIDGRIISQHLDILNKDAQWLLDQLKKEATEAVASFQPLK